jgi:hypothetical protein
MSNKNLLNEGTIRRFMKLAEIDSLANPFVDRINEGEEIYEAEEDDLADMSGAEAFGAGAASAEEEAGDEPEMDMGDEEMPDDMDMEMGDDEGMEGEDDPMAEIGTAIADAVSELLQGMVDDGTLEISQGEDTDEIDLDAEPEGGEEMADIEVSDEEPEEELAESDIRKTFKQGLGDVRKTWSKERRKCAASGKGSTVCDQEEAARQAASSTNEANIVAEVARRVTKRLLASR